MIKILLICIYLILTFGLFYFFMITDYNPQKIFNNYYTFIESSALSIFLINNKNFIASIWIIILFVFGSFINAVSENPFRLSELLPPISITNNIVIDWLIIVIFILFLSLFISFYNRVDNIINYRHYLGQYIFLEHLKELLIKNGNTAYIKDKYNNGYIITNQSKEKFELKIKLSKKNNKKVWLDINSDKSIMYFDLLEAYLRLDITLISYSDYRDIT